MTILTRLTLILIALTIGLSPLAAQTGVVAGSVFDGVTGQPVRRATVTVEGEPNRKATTDIDGAFRLTLAPGVYSIAIAADRYMPATLEGVVVEAGEIADGSTVMVPAGEVTTVDVVERIDATQATAASLIAERRLSPVVSDSIGGDDIRRSVASDAAGALEKVTGVSVADGGYVYVRGLGERYSSTMLNNAMLPTTEPERRVVPLDLFPAALIDNIKVLKTYTPDLPGEFSGGLVQLQTVEFPVKPMMTASMNYGFNTRTTFGQFDSYPGGGRDFFGFDDGTRDLPSLIPRDGRLFPGSYSQQEFEAFGRSFPVNWEPTTRQSMRPTQSYTVAGGGSYGRLGLVGAITFANAPQRYSELQRYLVNTGGGQAAIFTDYPGYVADQESARMGAVLNAAIRLGALHKLIFRNTLTRETEKEARTFAGFNGGIDTQIIHQRLRWVERGLFSTGVSSEHSLPALANSLFKLQFTYSTSERDEPDLREVVRGRLADGSTPFLALPQSGTRFYNNLDDRIYEPLAEWSVPFFRGGVSGLFKTGFRGSFRRRDFDGRRFRFLPFNLLALNFNEPNNQLFRTENISFNGFQIREITRGTDKYSASMDTWGGFAMVDLAMGGRWRVVGGVRVEDADIRVETIDPLVPGSVPAIARLLNRDPLPGVSLIYALTPQQNLRFGYGRTLSRPDFRELSPFDFVNVLGGFSFAGNPNLRRARIDNFDARWEWFFGGDQLFAASYFFKDFTDPIEVTIQPTTGDLRQSFINAQGARNQGIELEFRRNLGGLGRRFAPWSLQSNLTVVDSDVQIGPEQSVLLTSKNRPLMGQSRFIANFMIDWLQPRLRSNAHFYTNYVSRRITDVGAVGLPDIYQEGNMFLDFVYQYSFDEKGKWSLRFSAENLGDNHYHWTQVDILQRSYRMGRTFSVGTTYNIF